MKIILNRFILLCITINLLSISDNISAQSNKKDKLIVPEISVVNASLPLYLSKIDFTHRKKVSKEISDKIEEIVLDFYFNDCNGDSAETYFSIRNVYFTTIECASNNLTFYLIIFDPVLGWGLQSKLICYNNLTKVFYPDILYFNIRPLYILNDEHNSLVQSNLKQIFNFQAPEIEKIASLDNSDIFRFNELYHNGTSNAIETTLVKFQKNYTIDTLDSKKIWIGLGTKNE